MYSAIDRMEVTVTAPVLCHRAVFPPNGETRPVPVETGRSGLSCVLPRSAVSPSSARGEELATLQKELTSLERRPGSVENHYVKQFLQSFPDHFQIKKQ